MTELSTVLSMMTEARLDERSRILDTIELFAEKYGYTRGLDDFKCLKVDDLMALLNEMRR